MKANTWLDHKELSLPLPEQTKICREYMKNHPELRKIGTYTDRNTTKNTTRELELLLVEAENRRVECIVTPTIKVFFDYCTESEYYINTIMKPAGIRLIGIKDDFDSSDENWSERLKAIKWQGRIRRYGKSKQKE